jgi:enoyl-CoA hydratase
MDMQGQLHAALDQALEDGTIVVLTGREGRFSGGFDLSVIQGGDIAAMAAMLRGGFELSLRLLTFPTPVVAACSGHAIAMASFRLCSTDHRIGADGAFKITANEVAIGLTMPVCAIEVCKQRLSPAYMNRALNLAEVFSPAQAVEAGFLDRVVPAETLMDEALATAERFASLDLAAHAATKVRVRAGALEGLRNAIEKEFPVPLL